jgi:hypothetical protein
MPKNPKSLHSSPFEPGKLVSSVAASMATVLAYVRAFRPPLTLQALHRVSL